MNQEESLSDAVSRRIKAIRSTKGLNQNEIAKRLDIDRSNYHRMENRGDKNTVEQLNRLAKVLDVPLVSFLTDDASTIAAANDANQIYARLKDLEDRIRDKNITVGLYERAKRRITRYFANRLFMAAINLAYVNPNELITDEEQRNPDARDRALALAEQHWGVAGVDERGEAVVMFGNLFISKEQLRAVYERIEIEDPTYYVLIRTLADSSLIDASGIVLDVYYEKVDKDKFRYFM